MNKFVFVGGVVVGALVAAALAPKDSCCARVERGVRDKVAGAFGEAVAGVGDRLGLWQYTPGLLNLFGVS